MRALPVLCLLLWATFTNYGQTSNAVRNTSLPSLNPSIPNPLFNILNLGQGNIEAMNRQTIEQDMRNFELQRQQKEQALRDAETEFGKTILYKFPSNLNKQGADFYKTAYDTLLNMLSGRSRLNYKKAVFASEWAFYEGTLNFKEFDAAIKYSSDLIKAKMKEDKLPNTELAKNWETFRFFADTLKVKLPTIERKNVTHYPIRYDFEDFYGERDWSKGMVSKLLKYQTGQCHSMPLLYLILAEELGSTAYLANAPEHTYIKIPLPNGAFQNIELTNGHLTNDAYVLSSGYIKAEAIASKIYMKPLSKRQAIAQCLLDLAKGYRNKYGHDEFYLKMVNTALVYQPNNVTGLYMVAGYHYWLLRYVLDQDPLILKRPKEQHPEVWQIVNTVTTYNNKLISLGYEEMPRDAYASWLKSIEKEKEKSTRMGMAIQESLWQKRK
jgi:hypothetical protein